MTFEASRTDLARLAAPEALFVEADLANISSTGTISLAYEINFPPGVCISTEQILGRSDSRITLIIDRILERQIPVRVSYTGGTASEELIIESLDWDPVSVTVWGPEEVVSRIHHVRVPIFRESLSTTLTEYLEFYAVDEHDEPLDDELLEMLEFSQETIRVTIPVKEMKDIPVTVDLSHGSSTSEANTSVHIDPPVVKVSGDPEVIRDLNNIFLGTINMLNLERNDSTIQLPIIIPNHITNVSGETEATIHIVISGLDIAFRSTSNLQTINTPQGLRADILTQSLDIRIRGATDDLALVTSLNLRVVADLTDMSPGTMRIPARVYIDGVDAAVDPVGEYEITVTIAADTGDE